MGNFLFRFLKKNFMSNFLGGSVDHLLRESPLKNFVEIYLKFPSNIFEGVSNFLCECVCVTVGV